MYKHEYYNILISLIPQGIMDKYNFMYKQIDSILYVMVLKGMHGLVQSEIIVHTAIKAHLCSFGYEHTPITLVLWQHNKTGITF